ncbi:DUF1836 domain-containing protein [Cohnella massiliensis]|uniref:DUF1836 domain-containing protein n=1 Tax=Cohnella massiliensis TaxID=1816691 RepID=UPI0009BBDFDB|nr:DUF1836 domain-containing protein [Cohnella massiliensis]
METFTLTRREMALFLMALSGTCPKSPLVVLQDAWIRAHREDMEQGKSFSVLLSTLLPQAFEKLVKGQKLTGFSLHDIVSLGNLIEYTNFSITSMQNWVKRDFKAYLGTPKAGKKYSLDQMVMLFIIEDLKSSLDFESIRKLFEILFGRSETPARPMIDPLKLYQSYSALFEELDENNDQLLDVPIHDGSLRNHDAFIEQRIMQKTENFVKSLEQLKTEERETVRNVLIIALISVQTAFFHSLSRRYWNATLFLRHLQTM